MSDAYEKVKAGRLTFKGGGVASRSKAIDKKNKKKKAKKDAEDGGGEESALPPSTAEDENGDGPAGSVSGSGAGAGAGAGDVYTIDAAKKMKYEELFPVEARKFGYDPKFKAKSVEDALDDRVKKKADRYCK